MKFVALVAVPPGVVITIFPVFAPVGTVAVTCRSEFMEKVAATPPKVTFDVCVRLTPFSVTGVPTAPLGGLKLVNCGVTRKVLLLVRVPDVVVTVTGPVVAPLGTVACRKVVPLRVTVVAAALPNVTTDELLKFCPRIPILAPTLPEVDSSAANGAAPMFRL